MSITRVYDIKSVDLALLRKVPPDLVVSAKGSVSTSGWTEPQLSAWVYIQPPKDGIQDFEFLARTPKGIVLQAFFDINADVTLEDVDIENYWGKGKPLNGVRVHAQTNDLVAYMKKAVKSNKLVRIP